MSDTQEAFRSASSMPSRGGYMTITTVEKPETYLIGVDGKQGAHGNFRLAIECSTYR